MAHFRTSLISTLVGACLISACQPETAVKSELIEADQPTFETTALRDELLEIGRIVRQCIAQVDPSVEPLAGAINAFLAQPDEKTFEQARKRWQDAEQAFSECNVLLMAIQGDLLQRISHYPIEPGYVDSTPTYGKTGIIHDLTLELSEETLLEQHQRFGADNASLGLYVLGFLLGDGNIRQADDYRYEGGLDTPTMTMALPAMRRQEYLKLALEQWIKDWASFKARWESPSMQQLEVVQEKMRFAYQQFFNQQPAADLFKGANNGHYHQQLMTWLSQPAQVQDDKLSTQPLWFGMKKADWENEDFKELVNALAASISEQAPFGDLAFNEALSNKLMAEDTSDVTSTTTTIDSPMPPLDAKRDSHETSSVSSSSSLGE
ncbi:MAG: imelysin family protein [Pseudomonadota bacterium]|nr:imelysin family protein [Pseudomonadota bacterium]